MPGDLTVVVAGDDAQLQRTFASAEARATKFNATIKTQSAEQAAAFSRVGQAVTQSATVHAAAMQKAGDSTIAAGRKISSAGSSLMGIVAPIALVGGAATKMAIEFNKAMEQLHTQAGYSQKSVDSLSKSVLELAPKVGSSPKELAEGLFHVASAGLPAAKAMETVKEAAMGAKIGGSDLAETTYALVSIMKTAPKDIHSAADAMGMMNSIVGQGDLHMQDLVKSLSSGVVPAAKGAGLGLRDVGAAMDVLTARGVPAEVAGNRLQRTFGFMQKSSASAQKALNEIGISQNQLGEDLRQPKGLLVGLEDIQKHLEKSGKTATEQNRALLTIFGGARSATAAQTLIQNLGDLNKQYDKLPTGAGNVKKLGEAWAAVEKTPAQKIAEDEQKVNAALTEMGAKVLPTVLPLLSSLKDVVATVADGFDHLSPGMRQVVTDTTLVAGALALLSKPVGGLVSMFGYLEKGVGKFVGVFGTTLEKNIPVAERSGAAAGEAYGASFRSASVEAMNGRASVAGRQASSASGAGVGTGVAAGAGAGRLGAGATALVAGAGLYGIFGTKGAEDRTTKFKLPAGSQTFLAELDRFGAKEVSDLTHLKLGNFITGIFGTTNDQTKALKALRAFGNEIDKLPADISKVDPSKLTKLRVEAEKLANEPQLAKWKPELEAAAKAFSPLGVALDKASSAFHNTAMSAGKSLSDIRGSVQTSMAYIRQTMPQGSKSANDALAVNFLEGAKAIEASMHTGVVKTGAGLDAINKMMDEALSALGIKGFGHSSAKQKAEAIKGGLAGGHGILPNKAGAPQEHGPGHAGGGYIGHPGERGRDEVPIVVGRGEAVVNRSQQPYVETGLAVSKVLGIQPYGSLSALFSNVMTPHYMASGGIVAPQLGLPGTIGSVAQGTVNIDARIANSILGKLQSSTGGVGVKGVGVFDGLPVAKWIIPELRYAQAHGWHGAITSGYRPGRDPHTASGFSEHQGTQFPHGAVDFGGYLPDPNPNREAFFAATKGYTGPTLIHPRFAGDGGHASGTGYAGGGFVATAYGPPWGGIEGGGITATGIDLHDSPHKYIVAVDPNVIPLGTKMKIWPNPFGYSGNFLAADTGGAIKGNRIDFYDWQGRAAQNAWGQRKVKVSIGGTVTGGKAKVPHLTLTPHEAAAVGRYTAAATGAHSAVESFAAGASDLSSSMGHREARWAAHPVNLATKEGATTAHQRDELIVGSDKARKKFFEKELKAMQKEVKNWVKLRDSYHKFARHAHGRGAKKKAIEKAAEFYAKIKQAQAEAKELKGTIYATETEITEAETARDVTLPTEVAAAQADVQSNDLGTYQNANAKIDAEERAGILTPDQAKAAKEANARKAKAGGYGPLSEEGQLQVAGDLREFEKAVTDATSAIEAHTQAVLDATKAELDKAQAARQIAEVESGTLLKALADMMNGQIGGRPQAYGAGRGAFAGGAARY